MQRRDPLIWIAAGILGLQLAYSALWAVISILVFTTDWPGVVFGLTYGEAARAAGPAMLGFGYLYVAVCALGLFWLLRGNARALYAQGACIIFNAALFGRMIGNPYWSGWQEGLVLLFSLAAFVLMLDFRQRGVLVRRSRAR